MRPIKLISISLIILLILSMGMIMRNDTIDTAVEASNNSIEEDIEKREYRYLPITETYIDIAVEGLHSSNAILIRLEDNKVLLEKDRTDRIYPASITKIMTTIVAIEQLTDLEEQIILDESMFQPLKEANASMAGFEPNEQVKAVDLLYGTMLPSGADASIGLAEEIAGSEEEFAKMMNTKAKEIGMNDTNFVNTTGLHDDNHYSTIDDLATLMIYAMENKTFMEVFSAQSYSTEPTNIHEEGLTYTSTMFRRLSKRGLMNGEFLGGKTGYTGEAGLCLASLSLVDGQEYALITVGAEGNSYTEPFHLTDAINVYNSIKEVPVN